MSDPIDRQMLKADLLCGDNAEHDYCFPCKRILDTTMDTLKKFQKATEGSAPCDLFDDLSPITIVLYRIVVWIANRLNRTRTWSARFEV